MMKYAPISRKDRIDISVYLTMLAIDAEPNLERTLNRLADLVITKVPR